MKSCTVPICTKPSKCRGLCIGHYARLLKWGDICADVPLSRSHPGATNPNWKGGEVWVDGRLFIFSPQHPNATKDGYVYRYRLVMEKILGRLLTKDEVVHHIDGNSSNDSPENLQVMTQPAHVELHRAQLTDGIRRDRALHGSPFKGRKHRPESIAKMKASHAMSA